MQLDRLDLTPVLAIWGPAQRSTKSPCLIEGNDFILRKIFESAPPCNPRA